MARHFHGCNICGIGLGNFEWYDNDHKKWVKVEGEDKVKWNGGPITRMEFNEFEEPCKETPEGSYGWITKTMNPKTVCPDCFEKILDGGLTKQ